MTQPLPTRFIRCLACRAVFIGNPCPRCSRCSRCRDAAWKETARLIAVRHEDAVRAEMWGMT